MGYGNRRHPCSRCRKLRHLCPLGLSAPDLLFAYPYERARIPVHFRREDITLWRRCCRSQYVKTLSVTSAFILAGSCCSRHVGAYGHAISTTHPDPGMIVNRKPCNFTIAVTRFRPRPRPDVCLILSDRQKGLKTASRSCSLMREPVSLTRTIFSPWPRNNPISPCPPAGVNLTALSTRLATASISKSRSPCTV